MANLYKAFYKGRCIEVEADSSYKAQIKAAEVFKSKRSWEVTVVVAAVDDKPVVHSTTEL